MVVVFLGWPLVALEQEDEMKVPFQVPVHRPDPDSTNPVRAAGALTAAGMVVAWLLVRYLGVPTDVALAVAVIAGPVITAELGRLRAYAPATVARLLAARGVEPETRGKR
ncbi:MAG TPA: hypothetical protein VKZ67_09520 [Natronosporangium sp.]|nr:hypothetical protein [Natronosporangium sp.]